MIFIPRKLMFVIIILLVAALIIPVALKTYDYVLRLRYPVKYMDIIEKYTGEYGIDPYFVLAIIKAESSFNPKAVSNKGAKGLMQIHPDTGEWIAKNIGLDGYKEDVLLDPEINVRMACWYLNNLNKQFKDPVSVLAAYNAGSGNVKKWLSDEKYSRDQNKLEYIPFKETRDYIERITKNYQMYKRIYEGTKERGQLK